MRWFDSFFPGSFQPIADWDCLLRSINILNPFLAKLMGFTGYFTILSKNPRKHREIPLESFQFLLQLAYMLWKFIDSRGLMTNWSNVEKSGEHLISHGSFTGLAAVAGWIWIWNLNSIPIAELPWETESNVRVWWNVMGKFRSSQLGWVFFSVCNRFPLIQLEASEQRRFAEQRRRNQFLTLWFIAIRDGSRMGVCVEYIPFYRGLMISIP